MTLVPCSEMEGDYYFYIYGDMNEDISLLEELTIILYTSSDLKIKAIWHPFLKLFSFLFAI